MGKPLKLYGSVADTLREMSGRANGTKQASLLMLAPSKAEFGRTCDALGVSFRRNEVSDYSRTKPTFADGDPKPGVLYWAPLSEHGAQYRPVVGNGQPNVEATSVALNVEPTAEAIELMAARMRESADELSRLAAHVRTTGELSTASEALNCVANLLPNLRMDLLVTRPLRALGVKR